MLPLWNKQTTAGGRLLSIRMYVCLYVLTHVKWKRWELSIVLYPVAKVLCKCTWWWWFFLIYFFFHWFLLLHRFYVFEIFEFSFCFEFFDERLLLMSGCKTVTIIFFLKCKWVFNIFAVSFYRPFFFLSLHSVGGKKTWPKIFMLMNFMTHHINNWLIAVEVS